MKVEIVFKTVKPPQSPWLIHYRIFRIKFLRIGGEVALIIDKPEVLGKRLKIEVELVWLPQSRYYNKF